MTCPGCAGADVPCEICEGAPFEEVLEELVAELLAEAALDS